MPGVGRADHSRRSEEERDLHPHALLFPLHDPGGRLSRLCRRAGGREKPRGFLRHAGKPRHEDPDGHPPGYRSAEDDRGAHLVLGRPQLPAVRVQRGLRAAGPRLPARDRKAPLRDRSPGLPPRHVEHDDPARSQQVRALRPLHPRLQRDPGQRGARFRPARQPHEGGTRLRRGLHQLLLRLLRRVHAGLPHGGHHQQAGPLPGAPLGDREGPHDLHLLRRGLPARPQCL